MADDPAVKPVATIKPEPDHIQQIEDRDMSEEYNPAGEGGAEPMDIDEELVKTEQADLKPNEMDTEPVDQTVKRLNDDILD